MLSLRALGFVNLDFMTNNPFYFHDPRSWVRKMEAVKKNSVDQLFIKSRDNAMKFAMRLTGNREDAEDLIQEAFLKVSRALENREIPENPQAWMFTAIRNSYIDRVRKAKRRLKCASLDEIVVENSAAEPVDARQTPEEALLSHTLDPNIIKAISRLTTTEKKVLLESIDSLSLEMQQELRAEKTSVQRSKMLARVKRKVMETMRTMTQTNKWEMSA